DVTPDLAKSFGLERAEGGLVGDVAPDSPAARAGFERGDIIIEYAGTHVHSAHQLPGLVAATEVGRTVPVKILRNGKAKTLTVTVGEMPTSTAASAAREGASDWGVAVSDITPELARQFQLTSRRGVVITAVVPDSPADDAGLRPGDVILQVDRRSVHNRADYQKAVARAGNAPRLLLLVQRQGRAVFVALARSR
ncbi:MAG: PDZ domain-containing protein, partial [Candidatus Binatia bacterium]